LRNYGFDESARAIELGTNGRLDEIQAAILRVLLPDLDRQVGRRRALAAQYRALLNGAALELPPAHEGAVYYQFAIALDQRDQVREHLRTRHRIDTGIHFEFGVHQHPHFARPGLVLPVTERLARRMLSLPIQPEVAEGHADEIAAAVIGSIGACR
jgi:dTDP-4-amino-4,6-dideoxygalactose transaminase